MLRRFLTRYYAPDSGQPQGGPAAPTPEPQTPQGGGDVLAGLQRLIERSAGDAGRVAELLYRENYELRERARQLSEQLPAQGAVVLDQAQASQWQAYQQLGAASEVQAALTERDQLRARVQQAERRDALNEAARLCGYKPAVLERLAEGVTIEFRGEGDTRMAQVVATVNGTATTTSLAEYAQANWAEFLPALVAAPEGSQGTRFVRQASGNGGAPPDPLQAYLRRTYGSRQ